MSKSIKDSSINLGDTQDELYKKIVQCGKRNEEVILQMMILASDWDASKRNKAKRAFENRNSNYDEWLKFKEKYYEFFIKIKKLWDDSKIDGTIDTYYELFENENSI